MDDYTEFLHEVFGQFGAITVRRMFGGYGIYHDGLMFALAVDDALYLKADAGNVRYFEEQELGPFEYDRNGKVVRLSYFLATAEILEDPEEAAQWARRSYEAALRARKPKRR